MTPYPAVMAVVATDPAHESFDDRARMVSALTSFRALPHRLEPVADRHGVLWINDSKATNVASALVAIESMQRPTILLLGGRHILGALHLSDEALRVGGGVVLLLIAIRMIFFERGARLGEDEVKGEPFIVPLAIPLIAGPSAMATVLLLSSQQPGQLLALTGALTISIAVTAAVFLASDKLQKLLGEQAITALERLMGLVLTAIAVEMLLGGVARYIAQAKG